VGVHGCLGVGVGKWNTGGRQHDVVNAHRREEEVVAVGCYEVLIHCHLHVYAFHVLWRGRGSDDSGLVQNHGQYQGKASNLLGRSDHGAGD